MKTLEFLKIALKNYKRVGAFASTSRFTINRVLKELRSCKFIVEYGAGTGVMTRALLKELPHDGRLIAVEIDKNFLKELHTINDRRLTIIEGDVVHISQRLRSLGLPEIDAVISSVPFSLMEKSEREAVIRNTAASLRYGGIFCIYHQYTLWTVPILKRLFKKVVIDFELFNLFPCFIIHAGATTSPTPLGMSRLGTRPRTN